MRKCSIEPLEPRRLLSATLTSFPETVVPTENAALGTSQVQTILAQAISQSTGKGTGTEVAVVVDREGTVLGTLAANNAVNLPQNGVASITALATVRARTAALFESDGEAFTTRTARFIIQNHFPPGITDTAGGPLYGVQYSDLVGSDILLPSLTPGVSGDPGGIPLYIHGVAVGAIGVAGDFRDVAATPQLLPLTNLPAYAASPATANSLGYPASSGYLANPKGRVYNGREEADFDEAIAQAGAKGFMAPPSIRANAIFVGGLRLPFVAEPAAHGKPNLTFDELTASSAATEIGTLINGTPEMMNAEIGGVDGLVRNRANVEMSSTPGVPLTDGGGNTIPHTDPQSSDAFIDGEPADPSLPASADNPQLTTADVTTIIGQAVDQAMNTRAGIRKPNGVHAEVHVVVVDAAGDVLGAFRMNDGTNFSYDVAVQKARTAAYFSDDTHAISTRAIGFMAQKYFPPGIAPDAGPLFGLQNDLNESSTPLPGNPFAPVTLASHTPYSGLANGITIFPGGVPLYINGKLVGAVGVSGDGVDQDDLIAYTGANGYQPKAQIRSDALSAGDLTNFMMSRLNTLVANNFDLEKARKLLQEGLPRVRLPYVKFPRNPGVLH